MSSTRLLVRIEAGVSAAACDPRIPPHYLLLPRKRPFTYLVQELESNVFRGHAALFPGDVWFQFMEEDEENHRDGAEWEAKGRIGEDDSDCNVADIDASVSRARSSVSAAGRAGSGFDSSSSSAISTPSTPASARATPTAATPPPAPATTLATVRLYIYPEGWDPRRSEQRANGDRKKTGRHDSSAGTPHSRVANRVSSCASFEEKHLPSSPKLPFASILDAGANNSRAAPKTSASPPSTHVLKKAAAAKKALLSRLRKRAKEIDRLRRRKAKENAARKRMIQMKHAKQDKERTQRARAQQKQAARIEKAAKRALLSKLKCKALAHVNYPPEAYVESGSTLTKTWLVKNTGELAWPQGTSVRVLSKSTVQYVRTVTLPLLEPNQEGQVSVELRVPEREGRLRSSVVALAYGGRRFGEKLWTTVQAEPQEDPIEIKSTDEVTLKCDIEKLLVRRESLSVRLVAWPLIKALELGRQFLPVAMNALPKVDHWAVRIGTVYIEVRGTDKRLNPYTHIRMSETAMRDEKGVNGEAKGLGRCFEEIVGVNHMSSGKILRFCQEYVQKTPRYTFHSTNCQKFAIELIKFATRNRHSRLPPVCGSTVYTYATRPSAHAREGEGKASVGRCEARGAYFGVQADGPAASFSVKNGAMLDAKAGSAGLQVLNAQVEVGLQLRTGMAVKNGSFELNLLGFGLKLGRNFGVSTPFLWIDTE